jgi:hypothetical protein
MFSKFVVLDEGEEIATNLPAFKGIMAKLTTEERGGNLC